MAHWEAHGKWKNRTGTCLPSLKFFFFSLLDQWFSKHGPGPAASISFGNLLEMQVLVLNPRPSESKTLMWGPEALQMIWGRLKFGNPALPWAAFCRALKVEVSFKGQSLAVYWLETLRSQRTSACHYLPCQKTAWLDPAYFIGLSIAQPVVVFFPLTIHRTGKEQLCPSLWSRGRPGSLLGHPWPWHLLHRYRDSRCVSIQCFPTFAASSVETYL